MSKEILKKSEVFYEVYERKPGADKLTTTYCPGCGHGIIHKMIAEALEDFGVQDRTIFISPVGCSVFAYYYFHTGNVQVAHGRAPAVATGLKRANPDSIVISYQGDGDLAAIGGLEILHAANRGEGFTVIFVNNAIYGMTGGQMAPTTLIGQTTMTTPRGRDPVNDGYPIRMSEIIATLEAPVYVERVMLSDSKEIMKARAAIRKALKVQIEKNGFAFVEILSPCPSGWKMTPSQAKRWVADVLSKYFPVGVKKDISAEFEGRKKEVKKVSKEEIAKILGIVEAEEVDKRVNKYVDKDVSEEIKVAGFGGQGVLSLGITLAYMGMKHGYKVSWLPSYGPEMRGGTANCHVKISKGSIGSPVVSYPTLLIAMNRPSLDRFENDVVSGGIIVYDNSLIDREPVRSDVTVIPIPATKIADEIGSTKIANMVVVGAIVKYLDLMSVEYIIDSIDQVIKSKKLADMNREAIRKGVEYITTNYKLG
ncbi:MAG: 2-oxoacid:acceptor oxidoreductase family protein [Candidatus Marinimicrobia bacterium]|nr:2-oxoacid:acceptor oxidoreductase family protein [Candidatus Neomarinimicrobiota bacterium]HDN59708.1 2-ketoisovalerate ferredoxin oxidoreductase [Candidatus Neomarinimicrobiota bacterium]